MADVRTFPGVKLEDAEEYTAEKVYEQLKEHDVKSIVAVATLESGQIMVVGNTSTVYGVYCLEFAKQILMDHSSED